MKNIIERTVYYADTDMYGVAWHGAYLRWMEQGRVEWCEQAGVSLLDLKENHDITIPVVNINIRYKASAKLEDKILITTEIESCNSLTATFRQKITDKATGKLFIDSTVEIVATNNQGKLYRKMPEELLKIFGVKG
ncbi:acyl-CoA thioesterase [bacterium]|nr:acyl-CoA thioesterase [bacterium]